MATSILTALKVLLPSRKANPAGTVVTPTFNAGATGAILAIPQYREHLTDIFTNRSSLDSRALLQNLFITDPDVSASVNAFLTVADTRPVFVVRDALGVIDRPGQQTLMQLITALTTRMDYSKGFKIVQSLTAICEACRYMLLLRGAIGGELVISKALLPAEIRLADMGKVEWFEIAPAQFVPQQRSLTGEIISLDIPTFFANWFRKDPTKIYTYSPFVSAINTIAARQQVVNDLYRIMQLTGYPRMSLQVLEEVLIKNAPPGSIDTPEARKNYISAQLTTIKSSVANIRADQAFIHTDSVVPGMLNEKSPAMSVDVSSVITVLNSQNQAGLRTMATIIGRGESGVNTASVEARIFSLNAQALNEPIADFLSQIFTFALRLSGSESHVECYFEPVEMRSQTELETQMLVRSQRLKSDLSLGLITDDEYHLWMYGRLGADGAPVLSGTNFDTAKPAVDTTAITPNSDPLGHSIAAPGGNAGARDNKSKVVKK